MPSRRSSSKYHDEFAAGGRKHRLIVALHPSITRPAAESDDPAPLNGRSDSHEGDLKCPPSSNAAARSCCPPSPEQVWEAVATTAGNAAWLFPNEIEPAAASTTAWDPPRHFAVRMEQGDWFNALEFVIEGRDGGTSLLRYAHSGIFVDDWDTQYDAVQQHTDFYLHTLGEYLEHFDGRTATYIGEVPGGIQGPPSVGEARRLPAPPAGARTGGRRSKKATRYG